MEPFGTAGTAGFPVGSTWSKSGIAFAKRRGLSLATLDILDVREGIADFQSGRHRAMMFPHTRGGQEVGWKARSLDAKEFTSQKGGEYRFWNIERVIGSSEIFITEGEIDACSLVEAGVPETQVISCPHGANDKPVEDIERGYGYAFDALDEGLSQASKFILCTDSDKPGRMLREDLVRVFGAARCYFVEWPEGCKDANDALLKLGPEVLRHWIEGNQQPWPISGLYRMRDLPEPPELTLWNPGFAEWESKVRLAPRTVSVVTGHPGHGKTTLFMQIWHNIARDYGVRVAVASFETRAKPHHRANLRRFHGGLDADSFIDEHFLWLQHDDDMPTLQWLLDTAEAAVIRHGCRVVQLDPWNRLELSRPRDLSETEHIAQCLRVLCRFANDFNCHVQVVAHPAKMHDTRRGTAPMLEDIAGSKAWDSMVDQGFVVHRPQFWDNDTKQRKTETKFYVRKARFQPELGYQCMLNMRLNLETGRYESADYDTGLGL